MKKVVENCFFPCQLSHKWCNCIAYTELKYWYILSRKTWKIYKHSWKSKILAESSITPFEVFCKNFVDISYENGLFRVLKDSVWLQFVCVCVCMYRGICKYACAWVCIRVCVCVCVWCFFLSLYVKAFSDWTKQWM